MDFQIGKYIFHGTSWYCLRLSICMHVFSGISRDRWHGTFIRISSSRSWILSDRRIGPILIEPLLSWLVIFDQFYGSKMTRDESTRLLRFCKLLKCVGSEVYDRIFCKSKKFLVFLVGFEVLKRRFDADDATDGKDKINRNETSDTINISSKLMLYFQPFWTYLI